MNNDDQIEKDANELAKVVHDLILKPSSGPWPHAAGTTVRYENPDLAIRVAAKTARKATGIKPTGSLGDPDEFKDPGTLKVEVTLQWISTADELPWAVRIEARRL